MSLRLALFLCTAVILLCATSTALADVPQKINIQGILLDSNGDPVTITSAVVFAIWDAATDGDSLWSALRTVSPDDQGRFNILLGELVSIPQTVFDSPDRWLSIKVDIDPEMTPRARLSSVAYAYRVNYADSTDAITDGGVDLSDINATGVGDGQVIKMVSGEWVAADDNTGSGDITAVIANTGLNGGGTEDEVTLDVDETWLNNFVDTCSVRYAEDASFADSTDAITDGGVDFADIGTNGATNGQIMKMVGGVWTAAADDVGSGNGWADDGNVVRLETDTDSVGIGTSTPTEKLDVDGNIHASGTLKSGASIVIDGINDQITASGGTLDFDDENLTTTGKATIGPGNTNSGAEAFVAGSNNSVTNDYASISGGNDNSATGPFSTVAGGLGNESNGDFSNVGGGRYNMAQGAYSVITGGGGRFLADSNSALGDFSFIGGGTHNVADGDTTVIVGGSHNYAGGLNSAVGGGSYNYARSKYSVVAGGGGATAADSNSASGDYSAIGGGSMNVATDYSSTVSGGQYNSALDLYATVPGGAGNRAAGHYSFAAGMNGRTYDDYCTVGGGNANQAGLDDGNTQIQHSATVGGGRDNQATGLASTVSGGYNNTASGDYSTIGGGYGNVASGVYSTVPGGHTNVADGDYSIAGGFNSSTAGNYSMVFGYSVNATNSYIIRFFDEAHSGKLRLNRDRDDESFVSSYPIHVGTSTSNGNGAYLTTGGTWTSTSTRSSKENFETLNGNHVLDLLAELPVTAWNYKGTTERHIGPVSEDFVGAFDVGAEGVDGTRDDKHLSHGDIAGVALIAVKELQKQNQDQQKRIEELEALVKKLLEDKE